MLKLKFLFVSGLVFSLMATSEALGQVNTQATPDSTIAVQDAVAQDSVTQEIGNQLSYDIGYDQRTKRNIIGAATIVEGNQLRRMVPVSADVLLQGQVAGMRVTGISGAPGAGALTTIRGISSLYAGTTPLYIVDGIPIKADRFTNSLARGADNNPIADINPEDIESIVVLKDAHATAIYGARGANGVIIIKTHAGTSGKTYLDFNGYTGIQDMPKTLSVFNADQYRAFTIEKELSRGQTQGQIADNLGRVLLYGPTQYGDVERYNNNTNWQDLVTEKALMHNYNLQLKGGDALAKYAFNVGYLKQHGVITDTNYDRFNTRFNLDYKVSRKLSMINMISYTRTDKKLQDEGNNPNTSPLYLATLKLPTLATMQQDLEGSDLSRVDSVDYLSRSNPYAVINGINNENNTNRILGSIVAEYSIQPGLSFRTGVNADYYRLKESRFSPGNGITPVRNIIRSATESNYVDLMFQNETTINYDRKFKDVHALSAVLGGAYQLTERTTQYAIAINAASDEFTSISTGSTQNIDSIASSSPDWKLGSFFGSAHYAYRDKYMLGINLRADGSSRFGANNRWGYFPSVAAAWRISSEPFLQNGGALSELKIRTSFGVTGNQEIGNYSSQTSMGSANYFNLPGIRVAALGDANLKWETTTQFDAGIDVGFLNGRIGFTADFYNKTTKDLLNYIQLPSVSGFRSYLTNNGTVRNRGFEFGAQGQILTGAFGWNTNFTVAYNQNEILELPNNEAKIFNYGEFQGIARVGDPIGAFYGYKAIGVYASTAEVNVKNGADNTNPFQGGDIIFQDVNLDGVIDEADKKVIGNSSPDLFGGFANTFTYKAFDLMVFMDYTFGNQVYNAQRARLEAMSGYDNQATTVNDRWQNPGDITDMPRLLHGDAVGNTRFSSRWVEDASYIRFKSISLGYNVPQSISNRLRFLNNGKIYFTAQNLHTFTKYKGYDPEIASITNQVMYGVDYGNVPQPKSFILGVRLAL